MRFLGYLWGLVFQGPERVRHGQGSFIPGNYIMASNGKFEDKRGSGKHHCWVWCLCSAVLSRRGWAC